MRVKVTILAFVWSLLLTVSKAQTNTQDIVFAACAGKKAVAFWSDPEFLHLVGKVKCNEQLKMIGSQEVGVHVETKKGKQGWVLNSQVTTAKARRASSGFWASFAAGLAASAAAGSSTASASSSAKIMIFGGEDHKTYLGCLNCSEYAVDSVSNTYGSHGNAYSSDSIFNHYSQFGSAYSMYSACNSYASDPPVIVDTNGNYYGRLSLNQYQSQIGIGKNLLGWLAAVCQD